MEKIQPKNKPLSVIYLGSAPDTLTKFEGSELFQVKQLDTAIEAVNYLMENKCVDAIIAETLLPGTDGIQAYDFLKNERKVCSGKPFILIAHEYEEHFYKDAFEKGIDDYYHVSFEVDRVYNRIKFFQTHRNEMPENGDSMPVKPYKTPFVKRLFDIVVAGTALFILSPLLLLVIIAIKLESKGPFYYASKRVGANFKVFDFYKFRSMRVGADAMQKELSHLNQYAKKDVDDYCKECAALPEGKYCSPIMYIRGEKVCENFSNKKKKKAAFLKIVNDPRITKVGKFIRNTSIDELPQLINIIKGDMSIVGNRPLPYAEAIELTKNGAAGRRYGTSAGLTGLWQVEKRGQIGDLTEEERFELDAKYAENNSFWGDIILIFRTIKVFVQRGNV
jgi:lipopolysaccharide/colanic/teichoic acid biosynthesis glycosyltransferase